jgi:hypothetical protein
MSWPRKEIVSARSIGSCIEKVRDLPISDGAAHGSRCQDIAKARFSTARATWRAEEHDWHTIELQYPREAKKHLDNIVTRIARGMGAYSRDCG